MTKTQYYYVELCGPCYLWEHRNCPQVSSTILVALQLVSRDFLIMPVLVMVRCGQLPVLRKNLANHLYEGIR